MAKDITLKTRNGETRYPKSVTDLIFENGTGKTLQTIITELRTADTNTDTRTRMFKADVTNLDTLNKKTDIGLYNYVGNGWRGSVSINYDSADNVSQVALSSSTPSYNGNTLTWLSAQPCAMARTYKNGAWSHWEKVGAPVVNDLTTGGTDKALSAEMGKTLKEGLDALGPKIDGVEFNILRQTTTTLYDDERTNNSGTITSDDGFWRTNPIPVTAGDTYTTVGARTDINFYFRFYNSSDAKSSTYVDGVGGRTATVPTGATHMIVYTTTNNPYSTAIVCKSTDISTTYPTIGQNTKRGGVYTKEQTDTLLDAKASITYVNNEVQSVIKGTLQTKDTSIDGLDFADDKDKKNVILRIRDGHIITKNFNSAKLHSVQAIGGLNILCIGDSLTKGDYGSEPEGTQNVHSTNYPYYLTQYLGCTTTNKGVCGIKASTWWSGYAANIDYTAYDVAIIMLGTNAAIPNTLATDVEPYANYADYVGEDGAYCKIIEYALSQNPKLSILLCTPPFVDSSRRSAYYTKALGSQDGVKSIGRRYGVPVLDMFYEGGFSSFNTNIMQPIDGLHFGIYGYQKLATRIASFLIGSGYFLLDKTAVEPS